MSDDQSNGKGRKMSGKLVNIGTENYYYVAVKGSPFASDSTVFGLGQDEILALSKRFPNSGTDVINGALIKGFYFNFFVLIICYFQKKKKFKLVF